MRLLLHAASWFPSKLLVGTALPSTPTEKGGIILRYDYDVIVIGAGNGGLSAAATTVRGGKKTLVLERHNLPGGSATSFVRGRFEFESALHELCDLGTEELPGTVRKLFDQYGAKMKWHLEQNLFHLIVPGKTDLVLPSSIDPFAKKMEELVPGCEASVRELLRLGALAAEAQAYAMSPKHNNLVMMTKYADFLRLASVTTREGFEAIQMPKATQDTLESTILRWKPLFGGFSRMLIFLCAIFPKCPMMPM